MEIFYVFPWFFMVFHGVPRFSMVFHVFSHGFSWFSLVFHSEIARNVPSFSVPRGAPLLRDGVGELPKRRSAALQRDAGRFASPVPRQFFPGIWDSIVIL